MRALTLLFVLATAQPVWASPITCVPACQQRSALGRCLQWGPDFCEVGPGVACVPWCTQRSIQARCLNYGPDFCGLFPACAPRCGQSSINGMCLRYDADDCFET